jgi:hypothetical protein
MSDACIELFRSKKTLNMETSIGYLDGNKWEELCHKILYLKYPDYQPIPDRFGGDLGLEGFTFSGIAFQCYCPDDVSLGAKDLYEKQRDKITKDIKKLLVNGNDIKNLVGSTVFHEWHFLTPKFENKDLLSHCRVKETEVKKLKPDYIDCAKFSIRIKSEDAYTTEVASILSNGLKLSFPHTSVDDAKVTDWHASKPDLAAQIERKFSNITSDPNRKNQFLDSNIKAYLTGEAVLEKLQSYPDIFNKLVHLRDAWETRAQSDSCLWLDNVGLELRNFTERYKKDLTKELGDSIVTAQVEILLQHAIADWLIRCPLEIYR